MSSSISVLRARLRVDLAEPTADRWTDNDLDRHIQHAVRDLNRVAPREMVDTSLTAVHFTGRPPPEPPPCRKCSAGGGMGRNERRCV